MTGRALRSVRLALSLTVPEFSERLGIAVLELDAMERGEKAIESARLSTALERLAPDVQKLEITDPVLLVPPLPLPLGR
jgi:transcriptional regulator with XRE-family HTH domain